MTICYPLPLLLPRAVFLFIIPPLSSKARVFVKQETKAERKRKLWGGKEMSIFSFLFCGKCYFAFSFLRADCDEVFGLRRSMVGRVDIFKGPLCTEEGRS